MASAGRYSRRSPAAHVLIATGVVVSVAVSPAESQSLGFYPQVHVSASYTDNAFLSSNESDQDQSDVYYTLGFALPLARDLEHGSLGLFYGVNLERFQDFDELDNLNHHLYFSFSTQTSSTSAFDLGLGYSVNEDPFASQDTGQIEVDGSSTIRCSSSDADSSETRRQSTSVSTSSSRHEGRFSSSPAIRPTDPDEIDSDEALGDVEDRGRSRRWGGTVAGALGPAYVARGCSTGFTASISKCRASHCPTRWELAGSRAVEERLSVSFSIGVFYRDQVVVEMVNADGMNIVESDVGIHRKLWIEQDAPALRPELFSESPTFGRARLGGNLDQYRGFFLALAAPIQRSVVLEPIATIRPPRPPT